MTLRVGVVQFPGTNCELDVISVAERLGADGEILFHAEPSTHGVDIVVIPGGFAHGDYLRAGAIARFSPVMDAVADHARAGGPVVGICNGFQVLCEAGLLPGALQKNVGLKFLCQPVDLRVETTTTVLTNQAERGQVLRIPINHFEGNYVCDDGTLDSLRAEDRVVVRYVRNPNGSPRRHRRYLQRRPERRRSHAPPRTGLRTVARIGRRPRDVPVARRVGSGRGHDAVVTLRPAQAALAAVLREHAIREGEFTLNSGRTSNWYLDGRQVAFRGECLQIVGDAIVDALAAAGIGLDAFDAVGGPVVGAVPVALAVSLVTGKPAFAIRKEAKDHGVGGRIAGVLTAGQRVLIVEDTATTGKALVEALPAVEEMGCPVVAVSLLLDRGGELGRGWPNAGCRTRRRSARPTSATRSGPDAPFPTCRRRPGTRVISSPMDRIQAPPRVTPARLSTSAGTPASRQVA